jgi:hypothetical protein
MTYMEEKKNCFYLSPPHLLTDYIFRGLHYRLPVPSLSLPVVFRGRVFLLFAMQGQIFLQLKTQCQTSFSFYKKRFINSTTIFLNQFF